MINHKKVYRLCKELDILRPQRKTYPNRPRNLAKREKVTDSNQLWQMDVKYGYIEETKQFFVSVNISSQNSSKLTPNGKCRACSLVLIKVFAEIKGERKRVHFGP